jgi:SMI1 / KNR4 family (SUKH-1)
MRLQSMTDGIWRPAPPADEAALARLQEQTVVRLPVGYLDQLATSNGGEGDLAVEPGWIWFWPAEEVVALNASYCLGEFLPGFFGFGSNGGGELLAFDTRAGEPFAVVMVPFIPLEAQEARQIARSFDELRSLIGKSCYAA